jgi:hypothetical protein
VPPEERLRAIATFFSTRRSINGKSFRLIDEADLTEEEAAIQTRLFKELSDLRSAALPGHASQAAKNESMVGHGPWHFPGDYPVIILCAEIPGHLLKDSPLAARAHPDGSELSHLADLDSLFELHGHIRAVNPDLKVRCRSSEQMGRDDSTAHLVLLGGIDWNGVTRHTMRLLEVPVTQHSDDDDPSRGYFQVDGERPLQFRPHLEVGEGEPKVVEDVGHLLRASNPFNQATTVTFCNGMYGTGVLGAVLTLTNEDFRDRNAAYLAESFATNEAFSLLFRVQVVNRVVTTPDWTASGTVLHTWSKAGQ